MIYTDREILAAAWETKRAAKRIQGATGEIKDQHSNLSKEKLRKKAKIRKIQVRFERQQVQHGSETQGEIWGSSIKIKKSNTSRSEINLSVVFKGNKN